MTNQNNSQEEKLPETEEEFEQASDKVKARTLMEYEGFVAVIDRDLADLLFEIRVGRPPEGFNEADTRRVIQLWDSSLGYVYRVSDAVTEEVFVEDELPPHDIFAEDSMSHIQHQVEEHNMDYENAYEITHCETDTDIKTNDLARKVRSEIAEQFEE